MQVAPYDTTSQLLLCVLWPFAIFVTYAFLLVYTIVITAFSVLAFAIVEIPLGIHTCLTWFILCVVLFGNKWPCAIKSPNLLPLKLLVQDVVECLTSVVDMPATLSHTCLMK